jgi:TonB family protein
MSNGAAAAGGLGRLVGGAFLTAVLAQAAAWGYVSTLGPHGILQPKPSCNAQDVCVLVAGLEGDVSLGLGASGEIIGLDRYDDTAQRLIDDLDVLTADGQQVRVLRYPVEIGLPPAGASNDEALQRLLARARQEGTEARAKLVVIGRVVNDDNVALAFVDPTSAVNGVSRIQYELGDTTSRNALLAHFSAAIAAAGREPLPQAPRETLPLPPRPASPPMAQGAKPEEVVLTPPETPASTPQHPHVERARVNRMPEQDDVDRLYPARALERQIRGRATVQCVVTLEGRLQDCSVVRETPTGRGFGDAAVSLAQRHTTAFPEDHDGEPVANSTLRITYTFVPPSAN